jgi:hypothetical protein
MNCTDDGHAFNPGRRVLLARLGALAPLGLSAGIVGCDRPNSISGGWVGSHPERGHLLRQPAPVPLSSTKAANASGVRRTRILIAGGGVAGLAAARALRLQGINDFVLLDLEDQAGGNSRSIQIKGLPCPIGAHYLPLPSEAAHEVQDLLEEMGLRRRVAGRWGYDPRHLCHSPQERLFFKGQWQEGLLPLIDVGDKPAGACPLAVAMRGWCTPPCANKLLPHICANKG